MACLLLPSLFGAGACQTAAVAQGSVVLHLHHPVSLIPVPPPQCDMAASFDPTHGEKNGMVAMTDPADRTQVCVVSQGDATSTHHFAVEPGYARPTVAPCVWTAPGFGHLVPLETVSQIEVFAHPLAPPPRA